MPGSPEKEKRNRDIYKLRKRGYMLKHIALIYKIGVPTVQQIVNREEQREKSRKGVR